MATDFICATCGTDIREGAHRVTKVNEDGNGITVSCAFPRESALPRRMHYMSVPQWSAEYHYRARATVTPYDRDTARACRGAQSPADAQSEHLDTFGKD